MRDDDTPVLLEPAGLPAQAKSLSANSLVTFDASDGGGGVMSPGLLVDGNEVAHQDAGGTCREPFIRAAPCPAQLTAGLTLPVSALSPGTHSVSVRAVDAAGNVATSAPVTSPPLPWRRSVGACGPAGRRAMPVTIRPTHEDRRSRRRNGRSQASCRTRPGA